MNKEVSIIGATINDIDEVMSLIRMIHAEIGIFELSDDCVREVLLRALRPQNPEGIVGIIREKDGSIAALIFLMITRMWYSQQFHLEELLNFVHPDHRKSNYADALIRFAKHSADQLRIPLMIGILTRRQLEPKIRLYRRRLDMPVGAFFLYNAEYTDRSLNTDLWKHTRKRDSAPLPATALATTMIAPSMVSN